MPYFPTIAQLAHFRHDGLQCLSLEASCLAWQEKEKKKKARDPTLAAAKGRGLVTV